VGWGQEVKGMGPLVVGAFRTKAGTARRRRMAGGCLMTALALGFGPLNDPAATFPVNLLYT
jgi:hypothetical protein